MVKKKIIICEPVQIKTRDTSLVMSVFGISSSAFCMLFELNPLRTHRHMCWHKMSNIKITFSTLLVRLTFMRTLKTLFRLGRGKYLMTAGRMRLELTI